MTAEPRMTTRHPHLTAARARTPLPPAAALSVLLLAAAWALAGPARAQAAAPATAPAAVRTPSAAAPASRLVPAASEVRFVTRQMGVPVEGHFKRFDAQIAFDPRQPQAGKVSFSVDLASAEIGDAGTTAELRKPDWFDTARFPRASFQSTAIKAAGPGRFDVAGKLSIKGQVRDIVVPVTLARAGANQLATGSFTLKRLAFNIGGGEWADPSMVADEVQVDFRLTLSGLPG
ncbi:MAG: YceI family protein [Pseudomonadota bacterium]